MCGTCGRQEAEGPPLYGENAVSAASLIYMERA